MADDERLTNQRLAALKTAVTWSLVLATLNAVLVGVVLLLLTGEVL
jgi:hypothetical protein